MIGGEMTSVVVVVEAAAAVTSAVTTNCCRTPVSALVLGFTMLMVGIVNTEPALMVTEPVKYEEVYLKAYDTVPEARASLTRYLDFFNRERPHSSLDRKTPDEAYFTLRPRRPPHEISAAA